MHVTFDTNSSAADKNICWQLLICDICICTHRILVGEFDIDFVYQIIPAPRLGHSFSSFFANFLGIFDDFFKFTHIYSIDDVY